MEYKNFIFKEELTLREAKAIIENSKVNEDEYKKLLDNYEKLYNRFLKVMKSSDIQQKQLDDMNINLEKRVKEEVCKREVQEAILIQQSKMASMGEMISSITHQWKQPLNALNLILDNFKRKYLRTEKMNEECVDKLVVKSKKQINFMVDTIEDFKNFFKPNKEKVFFDTKRAIENTISILTPQIKEFNLNIEISENSFELNGYENEFKQVILNLINNAIDAIAKRQETGGYFDGKIEIYLKEEDDKKIILISDNGTGIDEAIKDRLFEPYFSTKGEAGTGIGLYMSKFIIEQMGGKISVKNLENGSNFIIEFSKI